MDTKLEDLCEKGFLQEALQLVWIHDERQGWQVSHAMLYLMLQKCTKKQDLGVGKQAHCLVVKYGLQFEPYLHRLLIRMYAVCGSMSDANRVFQQHQAPDIFAWTEIISMNARIGQNEQAIKLYEQMQEFDILPDGHVYVMALKCCMGARDIKRGKLIHAQIIENDMESDAFVRNMLIDMHAKLGSLHDAQNLFEKSSLKCDVIAHGVIIGGYLENGLPTQAVQVFGQMQERGVKPDRVIILSTLKAISTLECLHEGRLLHIHILINGFESEISVLNTLIDMYVKCGSLEDAKRVFDQSWRLQDLVTWNVMMSGLVMFRHDEDVYWLYGELLCNGFSPSHITIMNVLKACPIGGSSYEGRWIHSDVVESGLYSHVLVGNGLIEMYTRCNQIEDAESVFRNLSEKNVVSWSALISGYANNDQGGDTARVFKEMLHVGIEPNTATFISILKSYSRVKNLWQGKIIHCYVRELDAGCELLVMNTVMDMYMNCGSFVDAFQVFRGMESKDITTWNITIARCIEHGYDEKICELFQQMQEEGVEPDAITYSSMLKMESMIGDAQQGKSLHFLIVFFNYESNIIIGNNLIHMYSKHGSIDEAWHVFMNTSKDDIITWNVMLEGYVSNGSYERACEVFGQLRQRGIVPDRGTWISRLKVVSGGAALHQGKVIHTQIRESVYAHDILLGNSLLDMYGKCGSLDGAFDIFSQLAQPDVVIWCSMITLCAKFGSHSMALHYFKEMQQQGVRPTDVTFGALLSSFGHVGRDEFPEFNSIMEEHGIIGPTLDQYNSVVDLLGRVGRLGDAFDYLKLFPFQSNLVGWTSLLSHCRVHDNMDLAKLCFDHLSKTCSEKAAGYVLMADMYSQKGMMENAYELEELRKSGSLWKTPGKAMIEVNNGVHEFIGGNTHFLIDGISTKLKRLGLEIKEQGYVPL